MIVVPLMPISRSHGGPRVDVGDIVDGKYELTSLIGKGGMGAVYAATNTLIGKKVAVKVLHSSFAEDQEVLQRFLQEARAAAALEHPGCVEIFDFGWAQHAGESFPYIVMELMRGQSLSDRIKEVGQGQDFEFAVHVTLDVLSVLVAVHNKKIIHRDLKPENIFLAIEKDGTKRTKILDFGISKVKTDKDGGLTQTGMLLGTPYYMSPEQAAGLKDADHRIDVWAMGAILYQMFTDEVPFPGDSYNEILSKIIKEDLPSPRSFRPDLPEWLEAVVLKAMAWNRDDRYMSAGAFAGDLRARWEQFGESLPSPDEESTQAYVLPDAEGSVQDEIATVAPSDSMDSTPTAFVPETSSGNAELTPTAFVPDGANPGSQGLDSTPTAFIPEVEPVGSMVATAATPQPIAQRPDWAVTPTGIPQGSAAPGPDVDSLTAAVRSTETRTRRSSLVVPVLGAVAVVLFLVVGGIAGLMVFSGGDEQETRTSLVTPTPNATEPTPVVPLGSVEPPAVQVDMPPSVEIVEPGRIEKAGRRESSKVEPRLEPVKVAPTPTEESTAEPSVPPTVAGLQENEIAAGLRPISSKVRGCYEWERNAPSNVTVRLRVSGSGNAELLGANPSPSSVVVSCLQRAVNQASFRATGAPSKVIGHSFKVGTTARRPRPAPAKSNTGTAIKNNPFGDNSIKNNPFR